MAYNNLVLGIDNFAIRKGHTYNTSLHDLRGGTFLDVIPGRRIEELKAYFSTQPVLCTLHPVAIVIFLEKDYHMFAKTMYPAAIRIADRYYVNRYVTEALQTVWKSVQKQLTPFAKKDLKQHFRILGKRCDQLTGEEQRILQRLLQYSKILCQVYVWKEAFIDWYNCSSTYELAKKSFVRWLAQGDTIEHPEVQSCLKTMKNWQEEICNYHQLCFTHAAVECKVISLKLYKDDIFSRAIRSTIRRRFYWNVMPDGFITVLSQAHVLVKSQKFIFILFLLVAPTIKWAITNPTNSLELMLKLRNSDNPESLFLDSKNIDNESISSNENNYILEKIIKSLRYLVFLCQINTLTWPYYTRADY